MKLIDKIEKILKEKKVEYKFVPLPVDLAADVPSHAAFHKIPLANAMVTILYKTEKGIIGAIKREDTQIDQEKLKQLAGVKQMAFAAKDDVKMLGTESGLVPYLGLAILYLLDKKVLTVGKVYGTAGIRTMGMAMNAKDLTTVNQSQVGDFTFFEKNEIPTGKRFLSGITPSGDGSLHIGNYLGAIKQFIELAKTNETYLMVADLHALTTIQDKAQLVHNVETLVLNELALLQGFMTEVEFGNIVYFRQSDVPLHTEGQSILNNVTPLGLLKRAHAYKDKLQKEIMEDDINVGLFSYPMLMASDILLYKPDLVPVGKDQKQHIEITRDIAIRFNKIFRKKVFKVPEPYIPEEVAVIMGTDGQRKMSKSLGNLISIFESDEVIQEQVNGTYTDPTRKHATDRGHIEGNMVFVYLDHFGQKTKVDELKKLYTEGKVGDVEVKNYLYESLMTAFGPARERYAELKNNPEKVKKILKGGAEKARAVASETMDEVREAVGLMNQYSFSKYQFSLPQGSTLQKPQRDLPSVTSPTRNASITIADFAKVELRVGKVMAATNKEGSDKLIRLVVDLGSQVGQRIIFTGVRLFGYTPEDFSGKQFFFVVNLEPRKMLDEYSQGMILAVDGLELPLGEHGSNKPIFVSAEGLVIGAKIR